MSWSGLTETSLAFNLLLYITRAEPRRGVQQPKTLRTASRTQACLLGWQQLSRPARPALAATQTPRSSKTSSRRQDIRLPHRIAA